MAFEWQEVKLGDVVDLLSGFPFKSDEYIDDPSAPRLLRGDNVVQGTLRWEGVKRYPKQLTDDLDSYWLREDDVVLAMDRPWIDAGLKYAAIQKCDLPSLLVQRVSRLRGTANLDTRFLKYVIGSRSFTDHILAVQTGTAVPHISGKQIKDFSFRLPTIKEQTAIAEILGSLDDKIELNRRTSETLEAMARAIFKSWFVDFDPVAAKSEGRQPEGMDAETTKLFPDSFEDSEIGRIPKGWKVGTFGDVANSRREVVGVGNLPPDFAYIGLEHMPRRCIALSEWGNASSVESAKSRFNKGDVLFGKLRPYFHKVGIAPVDGICSTDILVITPRKAEWSAFVLGYASSDEMVDHADSCSTGTRMPRVSWGDLSRYPIPLPQPQLAGRFSQIVAPAFDTIVANTNESRSLVNMRDTLLPHLLSGELTAPNLKVI